MMKISWIIRFEVTYLLHAVSVILEKGKSLNIKIFGISLAKIKKRRQRIKSMMKTLLCLRRCLFNITKKLKIPEDYKEFKDNPQKKEELSFCW